MLVRMIFSLGKLNSIAAVDFDYTLGGAADEADPAYSDLVQSWQHHRALAVLLASYAVEDMAHCVHTDRQPLILAWQVVNQGQEVASFLDPQLVHKGLDVQSCYR